MVPLLFSLVIPLHAGTRVKNSFIIVNNGISDSNMIKSGAGVAIAVKRTAILKLYGDTLPSAVENTFYPDITMRGPDTIETFFVATASKQVKTQKIAVRQNGIAIAGIRSKVFDLKNVTRSPYLHTDKGSSGYLSTYTQEIDASSKNYFVMMHNGTRALTTDTSDNKQWIASTQCHMAGDTFLVMTIVDTSDARMYKVYSAGNTIVKTDSAAVITGASPGVINGALAADSSGTILAAMTRGKFNDAKHLDYSFFYRDLSPGPTAVIKPSVGENVFYQYDDVAVASYGRGKFALASWDGSGILLNRIKLTGGIATHDTVRAVKKNGMKFCAIASSNRYLVIAGLGDADGNGVRCIEGVRYLLVNGEPDSAVALSFSDPLVPIVNPDSSYSSAINVTVDDSGTMGLVWRNSGAVQACVWVHRTIRYEQSFYRSPVDSLSFNGDSIRFNPLAVSLSSTLSWGTAAYLRTGKTVEACTTASWISFTDTSVLSGHRVTDGYYQSKIYVNRISGAASDSFSTPVISAYTVSWNVQPSIASIDTVRTAAAVQIPFTDGDTFDVVSRKDSVVVAIRAHDADNGEVVTVRMSAPSAPQQQSLSAGTGYKGTFTLHPLVRSDTTYICTLTVNDQKGWYGAPKTIRCRTRNNTPELAFLLRNRKNSTGTTDSLQIVKDTTIIIQQEDTVHLTCSVADSNDAGSVRGTLYLLQGTDSTLIDSMNAGPGRTFTVAADTLQPVDTVRFLLEAYDADTLVNRRVNLIVNHPPRIAEIQYNADTLHAGDTTGVVIDDTASFMVVVNDTDCTFGDTLHYRIATLHGADSVISIRTSELLRLVPDKDDTLLQVKVVDRFGRSDSLLLHLTYPWLETDVQKNPAYTAALQYAIDSVSLISGSRDGDTVDVPIRNVGRSPLVVSSVSFSGTSASWLQVVVYSGTDTLTITSNSKPIDQALTIPEAGMMVMKLQFYAQKLTGDTLLEDTVILRTNDPRHKTVKIPVQIETNDLPRIVSVTPAFVTNAPYRPFAKKMSYHFPPHAQIAVAFSEPMDTTAALDAISIYSVLDKNTTGVALPLPLKRTWLQNNTVVHISPAYAATSPYFKLKPPEGLFIPTDSIALILTDKLQDAAQTPSGPNRLDIDNNYRRQEGMDTTLLQRIDSISFTVAAISPSPGNTDIERTQEIRLDYSAPFYAATVDTALVDNRSFRVTSAYNEDRQLSFSAIEIDSTSVTFRLHQELFYSDTLQCSYSSRWIRDPLGFSTDNSGDGIDITIFDSLSHEDDLQWGYRVRQVVVEETTPESASVLTEVSPAITIRFNGKLPAGIIDTDTSRHNNTFRIGSGRTGYSALKHIGYLPDSTGITIQPRLTFFSNDSVYCDFRGFTAHYRYTGKSNVPDAATALMSGYSWYFKSGEIGFYTFPNPYKPSSNARHCGPEGPCGIWFKNLHTLGHDISEVAIAVFTMNAHPVFDTRKKGESIRFNTQGIENLPQWKWDTKNNRGELVSSGLYLYAIYAKGGTVLKKGKLIIAR